MRVAQALVLLLALVAEAFLGGPMAAGAMSGMSGSHLSTQPPPSSSSPPSTWVSSACCRRCDCSASGCCTAAPSTPRPSPQPAAPAPAPSSSSRGSSDFLPPPPVPASNPLHFPADPDRPSLTAATASRLPAAAVPLFLSGCTLVI